MAFDESSGVGGGAEADKMLAGTVRVNGGCGVLLRYTDLTPLLSTPQFSLIPYDHLLPTTRASLKSGEITEVEQ